MQLSWTTFFFEIINFLVLVWILKKLLYQPILNILAERRNSIDESLAQAETTRQEALAMEQNYRARLDDWDREKQKLFDQLQQEIQNERSIQMQQLQDSLEEEHEKAAIIEQRQQAEVRKQLQQKAHRQGARFAARLLSALASPELEQRLIELFIKQLKDWPEQALDSLRSACEQVETLMISSAYPVDASQKQSLEQAFQELCTSAPDFDYQQNESLLCGLRIHIGNRILRLNLQDELSGYAELGHDHPIH